MSYDRIVYGLRALYWRRIHRKALRDAAAGLAPTVIAAIRQLDAPLWRGRWRHGFATISADEIRWRPMKPRPGPPLRLTNVQIVGGRREMRRHEHRWLAAGIGIYRVSSTDAPEVEYELGVFSESDPFLDVVPRRQREMIERSSTEPEENEPEEKQDPWWHMLLLGIAALAAAALVFDFIDDKERAGESFRINWIFAIVYQVLGKWGIAAVIVAVGVGCLVTSVRRFPRAEPFSGSLRGSAVDQPSAAPVSPGVPRASATRPFGSGGSHRRQPDRLGAQCAGCRAAVPVQAAYCGQCGLRQQTPAPEAPATAGADQGASRPSRHRRVQPRRWRRWHGIAALATVGLALVVALVAAGASNLEAGPMSARDTVAAYFDALADRDADRARSLLSQDVARTAPLMMTSGAALHDPGYHPPHHVRIKAVDVRDDVATAEGDYELDGKRERFGIKLIRDGGTGERQPWRINYLPWMPKPSGEYGFEALLIAGTRAPYNLVTLFHGSYVVSLPDHMIREVIAPITVRAGAREAGVIRVRMRDSARQSIEAQVRAYLDRCAASKELWPQGCPFSAYSPPPVRDVAWRITQYPTFEITLGSTWDAEVVGKHGEATVTAHGGSGVLSESKSFSVYGEARATTDKVLFVPR